MSRLELVAAPRTPTNRLDVWVGLGLYAGAAALAGYLALVAGMAVGAWLGPGPWMGLVSGALAVGGIAWVAALDLARRSVVWTFDLGPDALEVRAERRGPLARIPIPSAWLRAVALPDPVPAAVRRKARGFAVSWSDLRGASWEGATLDLHLSADRRVSLCVRGPDPEAVARVVDALCARVPSEAG